MANIEDSIKHVQVIKCEPVTPIFRPRRPETSEPKKGKIKIERYISSYELVLNEMFPLNL